MDFRQNRPFYTQDFVQPEQPPLGSRQPTNGHGASEGRVKRDAEHNMHTALAVLLHIKITEIRLYILFLRLH